MFLKKIYRRFTIPFFSVAACVAGFAGETIAQTSASQIDSFRTGDIKVTIDRPLNITPKQKLIICIYALPNGNTTAQTMGKRMEPGDDWHYDIQHIRAQTNFLREKMKLKNFAVVYLENNYKSWPMWKQQHTDYSTRIPLFLDSITSLFPTSEKELYLNGHSGGGSFIFGYLSGVDPIPVQVKRISFLDSDYGYDSSYYPKLQQWIKTVKGAALNVFAYNDSIALYNGKPVVSPTGGTWYRSHLMLRHLQQDFIFKLTVTDSLTVYRSKNKRIQFFFKQNTDRGIYHTQQVELNGFIHSILCGTARDSKRYSYYGRRAYTEYIE